MNNIEKTRTDFFPNTRKTQIDKSGQLEQLKLKTNDLGRINELKDIAQKHTKVDIPDSVKDFSMIKKAVNQSPDLDNTEKINKLKAQISSGQYQIDYDALAEKMLQDL